jgi:glutamate/tyrosine decarboxylase-like PLP-dependent enzyme
MGIITFRYQFRDEKSEKEDLFNHILVSEILADRYALLSSTKLKGRIVLHLCTINPRTSLSEIDHILQRVERVGEKLTQSF